mgnify:CR=1 FL=1
MINPKRIGNVTTDAMRRLVESLREAERSENTIKGYLPHLHSALAWAVTVGLLATTPKSPKIQRAKGTRVMKGRPITAEEMETFEVLWEAEKQSAGASLGATPQETETADPRKPR